MAELFLWKIALTPIAILYTILEMSSNKHTKMICLCGLPITGLLILNIFYIPYGETYPLFLLLYHYVLYSLYSISLMISYTQRIVIQLMINCITLFAFVIIKSTKHSLIITLLYSTMLAYEFIVLIVSFSRNINLFF